MYIYIYIFLFTSRLGCGEFVMVSGNCQVRWERKKRLGKMVEELTKWWRWRQRRSRNKEGMTESVESVEKKGINVRMARRSRVQHTRTILEITFLGSGEDARDRKAWSRSLFAELHTIVIMYTHEYY